MKRTLLTAFALLLLLPLVIQARSFAHSTTASRTLRVQSPSLDAAMRKFIDALKRRDTVAFLSLFSRTRPFYANNPMNVIRVAIPFSRLASDVRNKKGLYWDYLERAENAMYDAFVDNIGDGKMWKRVSGNRFVPPDNDSSSQTFVKWRREGRRWVIHEISYPQS